MTGDEDNDAPNILYYGYNNNYNHANYQVKPNSKEKDTPQRW